MSSLDCLIDTPNVLEGRIVSITPANSGVNVIVRDDTGVDLGNRRRWVGYLKDEQAKAAKVGQAVKFLPGSPRKGKAMGRAYDVEIINIAKESGQSAPKDKRAPK